MFKWGVGGVVLEWRGVILERREASGGGGAREAAAGHAVHNTGGARSCSRSHPSLAGAPHGAALIVKI